MRQSSVTVTTVVKPSTGEHGTVFVQRRDEGAAALPSIVVAGEHYNLIARLLQRT